jgi:hypothetical protein
MQTLGLSSQPQPADNMFKRLFWPSIESQYDVDLIGKQGFYVCVVVAIVSLLSLLILGMPIAGLFTALVYFVAGCGVRERSIAASVFALILYATNFIGGMVVGSFGNPFIQTVIMMLLLANVRATVISRRWLQNPKDELEAELPTRAQTSLIDRFANQLPAVVWPKGKYLFYPLATIFLMLTIAGLVRMKRVTDAKKANPDTMKITLPASAR